MEQISTLFVHKLVDVALEGEAANHPQRRDWLESAGLDPNSPVDPKCMIRDLVYYELCERIARESDLGMTLPLKAGGSVCCDDYGAFGLAWKSAINLRGSYQRAERYARVLSSVAIFEVVPDGATTYLMMHWEGSRSLGLRLSNEQTMAEIVKLSREVCPHSFAPEAVYFKHQSPGSTAAHEKYFGCPVHFGADRDALLVADSALGKSNRLGDPALSKFFDTHMEQELRELSDDSGLSKRVRIQISQALSEGVPTVTEIARRLGMSGRTLQRRLSEQDLSFKILVDESRRELAERLLEETDYALTEIAFLTGFSEQSAFNRAFKRWAGKTPRSYRLGA
ncbi:AraC family transcriptional regulator ligand-binding domain-containing protein [Roseibacillus persicicus]|uniref:AraC family transcriptional regulator ligand-binding domain-containing protein n=1 Tax=Roseibacillus persicicus TaxID=454148 RepID=UPI00398BBA08